MLNPLIDTITDKRTCNISRQDIYNWINKWNIPEIEYDPIESDSDTLYIMIDEKYIHEQIKAIIEQEEMKNQKTETKKLSNIKEEILNFLNQLNSPNKMLLLPKPKEKSKNFIMSKAFITYTGIIYQGKR